MDDLDDIIKNLKNDKNYSDEKELDLYLMKINDALKTNETTWKWFNELGPFHKDEIDKALKISLIECNEIQRETLDDDASDLRYSVIEKIAKRCLKAELLIQKEDFESAAKEATNIVKFIEDRKVYFTEESYMIGFRYIANCLAIRGNIKHICQNDKSKLDVSQLCQLLKKINEVQKFNQKALAGILAIKLYFVGTFRKGNHDFQLKVIKDLIDIDPANLEWRYCLYSVSRYKRMASDDSGFPSLAEINAISYASAMHKAIFDARICLGYAFCLAEILKTSGKNFSLIVFGGKAFYSSSETLQCIRDKVDDVLAIDSTSVRSNIDIAKIYSSILPYPYRNLAFAEICINRALLFHPNSSKANHSMAQLLISKRSASSAVEYLQKAVECDGRNFYAVLDLLKVYMANVPRYRKELEQLFSDEATKTMDKEYESNYAKILVLKAIYKFFDGDSDACVELLIEAVDKSSKCTRDLEILHSNFKRFNWSDFDSFDQNIQRKLRDGKFSTSETVCKILAAFAHQHGQDNSRNQYESGYSNHKRGGFHSKSSGHRFRTHYSNYGGEYQGRNKNNYGFRSGESKYGPGNEDKGKKNDESPPKNQTSQIDNYKILGISTSASKSDIQQAYRKLALLKHPDKNRHLPEIEYLKKQEEMKLINRAYHTLIETV